MAQIPYLSYGIFFLDFGQRYKKNQSKWQKYRKNVVTSYKNNLDLCKGFKNRAKIRYFQRDYKVLQESHIQRKVASKGVDGCYMGESWRKVAEIG